MKHVGKIVGLMVLGILLFTFMLPSYAAQPPSQGCTFLNNMFRYVWGRTPQGQYPIQIVRVAANLDFTKGEELTLTWQVVTQGPPGVPRPFALESTGQILAPAPGSPAKINRVDAAFRPENVSMTIPNNVAGVNVDVKFDITNPNQAAMVGHAVYKVTCKPAPDQVAQATETQNGTVVVTVATSPTPSPTLPLWDSTVTAAPTNASTPITPPTQVVTSQTSVPTDPFGTPVPTNVGTPITPPTQIVTAQVTSQTSVPTDPFGTPVPTGVGTPVTPTQIVTAQVTSETSVPTLPFGTPVPTSTPITSPTATAEPTDIIIMY